MSIFSFLKSGGKPVAGPAAEKPVSAFLTNLNAPKKQSGPDAATILADWGRIVKKQGLDELQRILDLPDVTYENVHDFTDELLRDPLRRTWKDGTDARLRPIQNRMLSAIKDANGGFFLVGTGAGKCVPASCRVYNASTGKYETVAEILGAGQLRVVSLTEDLKLQGNNASVFFSGEKPCVRLVLSSGTQLELSTDHQVRTARGWVAADDLLPTDLIATARQLPPPEVPVRLPSGVPELLAYTLADRHTTHGGVWFTDANTETLQEFGALAEGQGWRYTTVQRASATTIKCHKESRAFVEHYNLAHLSVQKRAPTQLFSAPNDQVALFLSRFIACDGYVNHRKGTLEIVLGSEQLIEDIRTLLLRLGVLCRKTHKKASYTHREKRETRDAWKLTVSSASDIARLGNNVPVPPGLASRWQQMLQVASDRKGNTNVDIVPVQRKEFQQMAEVVATAQKPKSYWYGHGRPNNRAHMGRETFARVCDAMGYTGDLSVYAKSDVFWDRLEQKTQLGVLPVYDLSVERDHNFIAEHVCIHNSFAALLAASVLSDCDRALVFTPSSTVRNLEAEYYRLRTLFKLLPQPDLQIRSTDELSRPREEHEGDLLEELILARGGDPARTLLVFDEAHRLKNLESARGARVLRTVLKYPQLRIVVMSGTMTTSSVKDCAHLAWYALRDNSPFPQRWGGMEDRHSHLLEALDQCISQKGKPEREHWAHLYRLWAKYHPGVVAMMEVPGPERVSLMRRAFQQRMATTRGVVLTTTSALPDVRLHLEGVTLSIPEEVQKAINDLMLGMDPNGMPIPDDVSMQRIENQVAQGFYYVWDWPIGQDGKPKVDLDWKGAKSRWNKMVRTEIQTHRRTGYDSDFLVFNACKRRLLEYCNTQEERDWVQWVSRTQKDGLSHKPGEDPARFEAVWGSLQRRIGGDELLYSWLSWSAVQRHKPEPPVRGVWLSTYLLEHAIAWAKAQERPPILWYAHRAVGEKLTAMGVQAYGQGTEPPPDEQLCALSIKVHCEGKNLQRWSNQLVLCPPVNAAVWEQMLARTHRPGQGKTDVYCRVYQHVDAFVDAVNRAREGATYIEDTTNNPQKLLACSYKDIKLRKVTVGVDVGVDDDDEDL